jgi:hypothetical protein
MRLLIEAASIGIPVEGFDRNHYSRIPAAKIDAIRLQ